MIKLLLQFLAPMAFFRLGFFDDDTQITENKTITQNQAIDNRAVADNGATILGYGASGNTFRYTSTDQGSIEAGKQVSMAAINGIMGAAAQANQTSNYAVVGATTLAGKAYENAGKLAGQALDYSGAQNKSNNNFLTSAIDTLAGFAGASNAKASALTSDALNTVGGAYKDAQANASGNKTIAIVGFAIVGVLAFAMIGFKK